MRLINYLYLIFITVVWACNTEKTSQNWSVVSPSGKIGATIKLDHKGNIRYTSFILNKADSTTIIQSSALGLMLRNGNFKDSLSFSSIKNSSIDNVYDLSSGKQLQNRDHANEIEIHFMNSKSQEFMLTFRAYNDGIAFRYTVPNLSVEDEVLDELTDFTLPQPGQAWLQPYDSVTKWSPGYEKYFINGKIGDQSPQTGGWCFPALFKVDSAYFLLTESNLTKQYFGSHLQNDGAIYKMALPDSAEAFGKGVQGAIVTSSFSTPWRVIIAGYTINTIVESNLVNHVSDSPLQKDFSWVTPGRASWSWFSDITSPKDFNKLKNFIDLAANMGWEYSLIDANWDEMINGNLEGLVKYANDKNVGIWVWYNSGGPHNEVSEQPRDRMHEQKARQKEMDYLSAIGVKGIKVDFFQSDKQHIIQEYLDILQDAADRKILVNFHGCTIPRGWSKTWPNLLSMESVRGAESYLFGEEFPEKAPLHNVQLAYTRNVIGPMDYTPVTFSNVQFPHITTYGHELALSIVFESGIVHLADAVESYTSIPTYAQVFLSGLPVAWDEIKFLKGTPDTEVMIARRKNNRWYIGYINGENKSKVIDFDFKFLKEGNYSLNKISDGAKSDQFTQSEKNINASHIEKINVLPYGGFVCEVIEVKTESRL